MTDWLLRIAAWLSQGINCVLLGGSPDMTVSSRCHYNRHKRGWNAARLTINTIFFFQEDHCRTSYQSDVAFATRILNSTKYAQHRKNGKMLSGNRKVGQS